MKSINKEDLFKQVKQGNISRDTFLKSSKKVEPVILDDRESIDRVADELKQFSTAVLTMNKQQVETITQMLKVIMATVNNISDMKVDVNVANTSETINNSFCAGLG